MSELATSSAWSWSGQGLRARPALLLMGAAALVIGIAVMLRALLAPAEAQVDFARDIRPILNESCMGCHGGVRQLGGVSFLFREEALGKGVSGRPTIVPGDPGASEIMARLETSDPALRMPYKAHPLAPEKIALIKRWIEQGAKWKDHWSFVPPVRPVLPAVKNAGWARGPLDRFVLAGLEARGMRPAREAPRSEWLRRVALDLTGLPATPEMLRAFEADRAPDAYQKVVGQLMASPAFGERWATMWLDLARYSDSRGFEKDASRPMWPYRDWVVGAFNGNMPYDQFVIRQLAGDLLPGGDLNDQIATVFSRLTPTNDEGGTDNEEFRMNAVMDRVATTWSAVNGMTMNCVQCHSHPYDPIRHQEYYRFLSFFNTQEDSDLDSDYPLLRVPVDRSKDSLVWRVEQDVGKRLIALNAQDRQFAGRSRWSPLALSRASATEAPALTLRIAQTERQLALIDTSTAIGPLIQAFLKSQIADIRAQLAKSTSMRPRPLFIRRDLAIAPEDMPGWAAYDLEAALPAGPVGAVRVEIVPEAPKIARHTPEGGFRIDRAEAWIVDPNGASRPLPLAAAIPDSFDNLDGQLSSGAGIPGTAEGGIDSAFAAYKLFQTRWMLLVPKQMTSVQPGSKIRVRLVQTSATDAKPALAKHVRLSLTDRQDWQSYTAPNGVRTQATAAILAARKQIAGIQTVAVPVMREQPRYLQRATLQFDRGNFLTKIGEPLSPAMPKIFVPQGVPQAGDRLAMARSFFAPGQPLTSRVAVNRFWEQLFGRGIVPTLEDFGSAGEGPSNQQLLDWMALHFAQDLRWNVKALLREIVLSATYRQSSAISREALHGDPSNQWLGRGPLQRLSAEMVRDQALAASGLLNRDLGGRPVFPPQPKAVGSSVYNSEPWIDATDNSRYRRAIYTFQKRGTPYPSFITFDAPQRDVAIARRISTNTPLQSLVTLNDPVYREAAAALARRMLAHQPVGGRMPQSAIAYGVLLVLTRPATAEETSVLSGLYSKLLQRGSTSQGAMTEIASAILNLDAAMTR